MIQLKTLYIYFINARAILLLYEHTHTIAQLVAVADDKIDLKIHWAE